MSEPTPRSRRIRALALLGGGVAAGAVIAGALTANAATTSGTPAASTSTSSTTSNGSTTTPSTGSSSSTTDSDHDGRHGAGGHNPDETTVTGANATKLKAAALAKVPGATVERVETDSGDAAYEVHMTKSDGTEVTVKFDKNLAFVAIEAGKGK